ncbi:hypothetical protein DUI87_00348 [Hirundo rustica rustica]|uniref:Plasminogen activator inhibitor 1 n=1 Tax=Hirundo rustica rustica TaxID=333673 RepID=A0A3M0LBK7_HIRRU|nr:hypothetical protein DUI87_00348 [Hirundo rustica rustica]
MRLSSMSLVALVALVALAGSGTPEPGRVSQLLTDFGLRLFRAALAPRGDTNVAFAPYGATSLLVALQVATAGRGRRQLEEAIGFSIDEPGVSAQLRGLLRAPRGSGASLRVARGLLVAPAVALRRGSLARLRRALGPLSIARLEPGSGEGARGDINAWARHRTGGLVSGLVPPGALGPRTRLALAVALSLRGSWGVPVSPGAARPRPFRRRDGRDVTVPMVALAGRFRCGDFETPSGVPFSVVEVPYAGGEVALLLAAPLGRDVPIVTLAPLLDAGGVTRFSLESSWDLRGPLQALGVRDPFDPDAADFSPLSGEPHLALGAVLQKVRLEVTENGTEAASASAAVVYSRMAPLEIHLDRPFLFLIRHLPTGTVLFVGQVTEP